MRESPNTDRVRLAASLLGSLTQRVVFLGGAALDLLITDDGAPPSRGTKDVDVIVEVVSLPDFYDLSRQLREAGFQEDMVSGVICRWCHGELVLDVMPTDPELLGFGNRWYLPALRSALSLNLLADLSIRVIDAPHFLATKLEAFLSPTRDGHGDFLFSRDLSDVIALFDGRPALPDEIQTADDALRTFLGTTLRWCLDQEAFADAISANLPPDHISQSRQDAILQRMQAALGPN